jgi:6-phosphogluconolactonase (cycloisomerase 2 family)
MDLNQKWMTFVLPMAYTSCALALDRHKVEHGTFFIDPKQNKKAFAVYCTTLANVSTPAGVLPKVGGFALARVSVDRKFTPAKLLIPSEVLKSELPSSFAFSNQALASSNWVDLLQMSSHAMLILSNEGSSGHRYLRVEILSTLDTAGGLVRLSDMQFSLDTEPKVMPASALESAIYPEPYLPECSGVVSTAHPCWRLFDIIADDTVNCAATDDCWEGTAAHTSGVYTTPITVTLYIGMENAGLLTGVSMVCDPNVAAGVLCPASFNVIASTSGRFDLDGQTIASVTGMSAPSWASGKVTFSFGGGQNNRVMLPVTELRKPQTQTGCVALASSGTAIPLVHDKSGSACDRVGQYTELFGPGNTFALETAIGQSPSYLNFKPTMIAAAYLYIYVPEPTFGPLITLTFEETTNPVLSENAMFVASQGTNAVSTDTASVKMGARSGLFSSSAYATFPALAYSLTTSDFTVATWVRIPSASLPSAPIFGDWESSQKQFSLSITSSKAVFSVKLSDGSTSTAISIGSLIAETWHHIAGTWSTASATGHVYVDGEVDGFFVATVGTLSASTSTVWNLGKHSTTFFAGRMDHFIFTLEHFEPSYVRGLYSATALTMSEGARFHHEVGEVSLDSAFNAQFTLGAEGASPRGTAFAGQCHWTAFEGSATAGSIITMVKAEGALPKHQTFVKVQTILDSTNAAAADLKVALLDRPVGLTADLSSDRVYVLTSEGLLVFERQSTCILTLIDTMSSVLGQELDGIRNPVTLALSPDSAYLYIASTLNSGQIVVVDTGLSTGVLKLVNRIEATVARPMTQPRRIHTSACGRFVYMTSSGSSTLHLFQRLTNGELVHEASQPVVYDAATGLTGGLSSATFQGVRDISSYRQNVYIVAETSDTLMFFKQDYLGALSLQQTLTGGALSGPCSIAVSPGGETVYVGLCGAPCLVSYQRNLATGQLTLFQQRCSSSQSGSRPASASLEDMSTLDTITVSPDGSGVSCTSSNQAMMFNRQYFHSRDSSGRICDYSVSREILIKQQQSVDPCFMAFGVITDCQVWCKNALQESFETQPVEWMGVIS